MNSHHETCGLGNLEAPDGLRGLLGVYPRLRCQAAVDDEAGARDEGGAVGCEVGDGVGHLFRRGDTP